MKNHITVKRKKNLENETESMNIYIDGQYLGNIFVTGNTTQVAIHGFENEE